jgi:hypothetical protein
LADRRRANSALHGHDVKPDAGGGDLHSTESIEDPKPQWVPIPPDRCGEKDRLADRRRANLVIDGHDVQPDAGSSSGAKLIDDLNPRWAPIRCEDMDLTDGRRALALDGLIDVKPDADGADLPSIKLIEVPNPHCTAIPPHGCSEDHLADRRRALAPDGHDVKHRSVVVPLLCRRFRRQTSPHPHVKSRSVAIRGHRHE